MNNKVEQKAIIEGLFTLDADKPRLIGSKCESCGTYFFPEIISCVNPNCRHGKVQRAHFGGRGKLFSFTIQYYAPPPPFKGPDPFVPYGIGFVEFPENIRVLGMLTEADPAILKVGMEVELVLGKLYEEDGKEVVTWKFRPI